MEERKRQFDADLIEAVKTIDLQKWRVFVLRWSEALHVGEAPPGGWENEELILPIIHSARVARDDFTLMERVKSASWLISHGRPLPNGLRLENGELVGGRPVRSSNVVN
jgi:hypothetical protein